MSPARIASTAAVKSFVFGFFKFCGWNREPDQRPVEAA